MATAWRSCPLRHGSDDDPGEVGQNSAPDAANCEYDRLSLSSSDDEGGSSPDRSPQAKPEVTLRTASLSSGLAASARLAATGPAANPPPPPAVSAGLHFSPTFNMQGATIGSFSINIASGANAPTVQYSGRGASGEVRAPFGTSFVDVSSEARGDLWAAPRGDEGGFERPKPQTAFQAMMSRVKSGTAAGQVRQLAAASKPAHTAASTPWLLCSHVALLIPCFSLSLSLSLYLFERCSTNCRLLTQDCVFPDACTYVEETEAEGDG